MSKEALNAKLAELVKAFETALSEAEAFADEHGLSFYISPAYGMGGRYEGCGPDGDPNAENEWGDNEFGWMPSSQGC